MREPIPIRLVVTPHGNGSKILVGGVELKNVRSFTLSRVGIDDLVTVTVEFVNVSVEVEGHVDDVTTLQSIVREYAKR